MVRDSFLYKLLYDESQDDVTKLRLDVSGMSAKELQSFMRDMEDLRSRFYGAAQSSASIASVAGDEDAGDPSADLLSTVAFYTSECIEMGDVIGHALTDLRELSKEVKQ